MVESPVVHRGLSRGCEALCGSGMPARVAGGHGTMMSDPVVNAKGPNAPLRMPGIASKLELAGDTP